MVRRPSSQRYRRGSPQRRLSLVVSASGTITTKMTVLLTPETIDQATKKSARNWLESRR